MLQKRVKPLNLEESISLIQHHFTWNDFIAPSREDLLKENSTEDLLKWVANIESTREQDRLERQKLQLINAKKKQIAILQTELEQLKTKRAKA